MLLLRRNPSLTIAVARLPSSEVLRVFPRVQKTGLLLRCLREVGRCKNRERARSSTSHPGSEYLQVREPGCPSSSNYSQDRGDSVDRRKDQLGHEAPGINSNQFCGRNSRDDSVRQGGFSRRGW